MELYAQFPIRFNIVHVGFICDAPNWEQQLRSIYQFDGAFRYLAKIVRFVSVSMRIDQGRGR